MSMVHKEEIICPKCQAHGEFDIWESMNVDLNPELRDKVFSEDAFFYKCPECGAEIAVPYDFVYHDMTHKFIIMFSFFEPEDFDYEPYELPLLSEAMKGYTYRHVNGIYELKEKILILEKGLNDVAIEHMKYACSHYEYPIITEHGNKLYFSDIKYDLPDLPKGGIVFYINLGEDRSKKLAYPLNLYNHQCLACELDPRMKVEGCETVDEGWMALRLSGKGSDQKPFKVLHGKNDKGFYIVANTKRGSKGNSKVKYAEGIAHDSGDILFPMIFDNITWNEDGEIAFARLEGKPYILTLFGGIFDPEKAKKEMEND